ncbi:MAG: MBL fold metallo-hydrolase [Candidatus Coatesbacteria bacterium]
MAMFEDEYYDIVRKAMVGAGLHAADLAACAGFSVPDVQILEAGAAAPNEAHLRAAAAVLGLSADKLADLALRPEPPRAVTVPPPFERLALERAANCYILGDPETRQGVIVDPGDEPDRIVAAVESAGVAPAFILVTHGHGDHDGALAEVLRRWPVPVVRAEPGREFAVGGMRGRVREVPGHTEDSVVFIFDARRVAFTGDALFARSLGGTRGGAAYRSLLDRVAAEILSLPPDTVLAPGHGPLTTAGDERRLNPFFP